MITLAIETSCDETAVCLLETEETPTNQEIDTSDRLLLNYKILGNIIHSQVELHRQYGGVFPIMAKREHSKKLVPLLETLINESGISTTPFQAGNSIDQITKILQGKEPDLLKNILASSLISRAPTIDQIAVTKGPGLEPALWVGVNCAQALSLLWNIPIVAVNHMEGHIVGSLLDSVEIGMTAELRPVQFPALALLISGGHTELVVAKKIGDYEVVGRTKDDAVGEAFDKVARMLDLPYPGGVHIHTLAEKARHSSTSSVGQKAENDSSKKIALPRPMIHSHDLNFSFSGLKTAVLYTLRDLRASQTIISEKIKEEIAREFEDAVTDVLIKKTEKAIAQCTDDDASILTLILGGGVSANLNIQSAFEKLATQQSMSLYLPPQGVSGDNALMIALAGALHKQTSHTPMKAEGNLSL